MAFSIKDPVVESLARELAERTGENIVTAMRKALEERLRRVSHPDEQAKLAADLAAIRQRWAALPILDGRSADDILGYDQDGLSR